MTEVAAEENKMGVMPVGKLLVSMSVPAMISMCIQALYNIVDSIFVSRISETALTAISLAYPMQMLMISFAVGMSVGICSVVSRRLGEKRYKEASNAARAGYSLELICALGSTLLGLFFSKTFFSLYTDDIELIDMGTKYLTICMGAGFGCFILQVCEKSLQATGDMIHPMIIQMSGAIFNIIFDPIFIFGYFGLPAMGITGAAIATVLGQIFSMIIGIFFVKKSPYISIKFLKLRFNKQDFKDILAVGVPAVILQGIGTVMTSLMNAVLIAFDVLATTVFGIYFKLQSFVFMPIFGLSQGLMPILGYNYGARNKDRMNKALRLGMAVSFIIMVFGWILFSVFPDALLKMFNASDAMLEIGRVAMRSIALSFPLAAISITLGTLFQAIGDGFYSMINSIVRQIVILVPAAWLLGHFFGLNAVWYSFIIAEVFALSLSLIFYIIEKKKLDF